ncbi:MAG TPA: glycosyl transferase family 1 [Geobacter sp.]|nr:glycosyl transferase family 1 [Geobacter sp.]
MRILIVGNDPMDIGGVANYTRPLAIKFAEHGHEVRYLYSGAYHSRYDLSLKPYLKLHRDRFPFECAEIINSECLPFNFGNPEIDMQSPGMAGLLSEYLDRVQPDVMHVHSRFGLPAAINRIASEKGIKVVNTIHVYGYICQKRVMIDHEGKPCPGPSDLERCAVCTGELSYRKERFRAVLRNYNKALKLKSPAVFRLMQRVKGSLGPAPSGGEKNETAPGFLPQPAPQLARRLAARLRYCTETLSRYSDSTICVSNDVKTTLESYGVDGRRLLVQHIGSVIAERQVADDHPLHDPIVIGNIGGVNHYKGTHVLVEAVSKLPIGNFVVRIFGKYDEEYVRVLKEGSGSVPVEFTGRYHPEELPEILRQIDVMVLPSICNDTAPQTIFESFSGGVPIIASRIGGFPDFVRHDHNGLLFEPGNSDDLAEKIAYVLSDPQRLVRYRENIPRLKTITENARELVLLYEELLEKGSGYKKASGSRPLQKGERC